MNEEYLLLHAHIHVRSINLMSNKRLSFLFQGLSSAVGKPHLRNLFYRVRTLLRVGAKLVFVVDGTATQLKWATLEQRGSQRAQLVGEVYVSGSSGNRPQLDDSASEVCIICTRSGSFLQVMSVL